MTSKHGHPLLYTYSLIIALICGTAGLPHILVRFYTNPDGRAAKRTTLWVMVMLGPFYVFPPIWGTLGRIVEPSLYATGTTDQRGDHPADAAGNPCSARSSCGITSAGAFAAFMSTFSGLLVSMSGRWRTTSTARSSGPGRRPSQRMRMFKFAAVLIGAGVDGAGVPGRVVRHRHDGRLGVRDRGVLVLPAPAARVLVARA